jgi:malate dehydrogenase
MSSSSSSSSLKIVVSGAAGQIAYSLLPLICIGHVFGPTRRVSLRLLDIPVAQEALEGVKMELQDCAFHLVDDVTPTSDLEVAFRDVDVAILVGGFPRKQGMQRKDLIEKNVTIFKAQGEALEQFASRHVKVLVVANPANTNCLIAMENAPSIPRANFSALTRLDHERLRSFVVERVNATSAASSKVSSLDVRKCIIWGNHSSTQVPDVTHARVNAQPLAMLVTDAHWVEHELVKDVQERGAAIIKARKLSSAMSAAAAVGAHLRDWFHGTKAGEFVSMAVASDGNAYGVPDGLIYSFPVTCAGDGTYEVVPGIAVSPRIQAMMQATAAELADERADAQEILAKY